MWRSLLILLCIGVVCGLITGWIGAVRGQSFWGWAGYGIAGGIFVVCAIIAWVLCSGDGH